MELSAVDLDITGISESKADTNVFEFDLSLWTMIKALAEAFPKEVAEEFSLTAACVETLANACSESLRYLASGVILSFRVSGPEQPYIEFLENCRGQTTLENFNNSGFAQAYWLLFSSVAKKDVLLAAETFGLSKELSLLVKNASDNELRCLATNYDMPFHIRLSSELISQLLKADVSELERRRLLFIRTQYLLNN